MKSHLHPVSVSPGMYKSFEEHARECLEVVRHTADDGTHIYYPDGGGKYEALWIRDFYYMVAGAGHLIPPEEILGCIDYIISGQREDGTVPDRVKADGTPVYQAGPVDDPLGAKPPADNPMFLAKLVCEYATQQEDFDTLDRHMQAIVRAMDTVPLSRDGLVFVDPNAPHPGYGFTDCIAKTGKVLYSSLLYWETCKLLGQTCAKFELHDDAHYWYERVADLEDLFDQFVDDELGVYMAASESCKQFDIWGNAYAAVIRIYSKSRAKALAEIFIDWYPDFVFAGCIRHLLIDESWERLLREVEVDTYQNGGFWPLATGWVAQTIALLDEGIARMLLDDLLVEFDENGVSEWVTPSERVGTHYAASACSVLASIEPSENVV